MTRSGSRKARHRVTRGSRIETRMYSGPSGSRAYRLHVPASLLARERSLVVMLHGCTQDAAGFATATGMGAQAERHGLIVAYPEQTTLHNSRACWNWYRPGDQCRGAGEPELIAGIVGELAREFGVEPERTFIAGLSAGGAMAAVMGETYPELFGAVGVHSGVACGTAYSKLSALISMQSENGWLHDRRSKIRPVTSMRTIVFHGTADDVVRPANADRVVASAEAGTDTAVRCRTATSPGGRTYTVAVASPPDGPPLTELWLIESSGHAWSGGAPDVPFTDPAGPDASAEMVRFFMAGA